MCTLLIQQNRNKLCFVYLIANFFNIMSFSTFKTSTTAPQTRAKTAELVPTRWQTTAVPAWLATPVKTVKQVRNLKFFFLFFFSHNVLHLTSIKHERSYCFKTWCHTFFRVTLPHRFFKHKSHSTFTLRPKKYYCPFCPGNFLKQNVYNSIYNK